MERISVIAIAIMMALAAAPAQAAPIGPIVAGTPWWVYALLALLAYNGLAFTKTRLVPVWRLLIQPGVFIAWGLISAGLATQAQPILAFDWLALAAAGAALALATAQVVTWPIDREHGLVRVPGSLVPLLRGLAIFAAKYGLGVAAALHVASPGSLHLLDMAVSGASAGYFAAWSAQLAFVYRRRPVAAALASPREGVSL